MKIADCIFHFNDKKALDDQSSETCKSVREHFWGSLLGNQLAKEFVSKDVFRIQDSYHSIHFYPAYAAAVLFKKVDSLDVFVRSVGLDGWNTKIHASTYGRERYAVPNLQAPTIMDQGIFPIHQIEELKVTLEESLSECSRVTKRRKVTNHEGNQKTPSFLNEKLGQSIRSVISKDETDLDENTDGNGRSAEPSAYGGTTDVGMHTGAKKRNTAAPLVFSVISVMLRLAGRRESDFHTLMAIYLSSFLDELPKVKLYDARAIDRFIIVMREAQPFVKSLKDKNLHQRILQKMKTYYNQLYSVPYARPQPPLKQHNVSKIVNRLRSPEFPRPAVLVLAENESGLERSRNEARKNLLLFNMKSKSSPGSLQEAWVQLHGLNVRFWKAASTLNHESTPEPKRVEILKADFERFSSIVSVALESANNGRYTMSTVIRSYELLAGTICFCFAHREMEVNHKWFKNNYIPAFDPQNLDHLVLDDKRAIDATDQVRQFLVMRAEGEWTPFRNHEDTMNLAKEFASRGSPRSKRNRKVHQDFLEASKKKIDQRWREVSERQTRLCKLDIELKEAKDTLCSVKANLSRLQRSLCEIESRPSSCFSCSKGDYIA